MDRGVIQVYYGEGHGKSTAAIGNAIRIASEGKSVIIIQVLNCLLYTSPSPRDCS